MGEEIFGPVLPVLTYRSLDQAFDIVRTFEKPLACYVFSDDKQVQHRVLTRLPFGGATVNDVVIHLANNHMGFGGVGQLGHGGVSRQGGLRLLHPLQVHAQEGHLAGDAHPQPTL